MEMPRMDGLTFLKKLMQHYPVPIVVISSHTSEGCRLTLEALENGAIDVIEKPVLTGVGPQAMQSFTMRLCDTVKAASKVRMKAKKEIVERPQQKGVTTVMPRVKTPEKNIIAIGASTGGTDAIKEVLRKMPPDCPPIMIVQHMPEGFTKAFANRLNNACRIEVLEGEENMKVIPGRAIIAPGDKHMLLHHVPGASYVRLKDGPLVCRHKPSVEVLFNSVAKAKITNRIGVILTGMGRDGAEGLLNLKNSGGKTVAQSEDGCVVFGMPKEAIDLGAAERVIILQRITSVALSLCI
jgi:two-component system chemotaxis response regulator CheB